MIAAPPRIDILPEHLIDQIKAGEVIERTGSLLKEVLENAIDAGATKIELTIKNNGLDLIGLKDNGHGMHFDDLPLAFSRHATSKISKFEDLYRLRSYGFRGEALASIASISKLQCITTVNGPMETAEMRIEGGKVVLHEKRHGPGTTVGTELIIQDLFYNTPARLKFIQSQNSERSFIKKIVFSFVLSNPAINFHLKFEDNEKEVYLAVPDIQSRIIDLAPKADGQILYSQRQYDGSEVRLFLVPSNFRAPLKMQYIFINNRLVLDKQLHRVLTNSLMSAHGSDEFHFLAFLHLPTDHIDVNVHPNKTIIKCFDPSKIMGLLTSTVKELIKDQRPHAESRPHHEAEQNLHFSSFDQLPTLPQERHEYNMEGVFSPHGNLISRVSTVYWVMDNYFITTIESKWCAIAAKRLLWAYVEMKLTSSSSSIPLLVSEPYSAKNVSEDTIQKLNTAGLEIERLAADTLVLRSIPEWMNGFPLKDIVTSLLLNKKMDDLSLHPADWSNSTWEEMIGSFGLRGLIESKIALDLGMVLKEKLK